MANHGFISSKKNLTKETVLADLQEINERRFKGKLKIEESQWGDKGSWFISYKSEGAQLPTGFNIWIRSIRKLEHRHTHNWGFYLELVFSEELGAKYSGTLTDEGFSGGWKPEPQKYPSYKAWLDIQYGHTKRSKLMKIFINKLIKKELDLAPAELRDC